MKAVNKFKVDFRPLKKSEEGNLYQITIQIPMELGWIEDVKFILEDGKNKKEINMTYFDKGEEMAYFKTETFIETKAIYHYYFSCKANGNFIYLKHKNKENNQMISEDEKWKLSVNFDVPEWAKGKVMYHVFLGPFLIEVV